MKSNRFGVVCSLYSVVHQFPIIVDLDAFHYWSRPLGHLDHRILRVGRCHHRVGGRTHFDILQMGLLRIRSVCPLLHLVCTQTSLAVCAQLTHALVGLPCLRTVRAPLSTLDPDSAPATFVALVGLPCSPFCTPSAGPVPREAMLSRRLRKRSGTAYSIYSSAHSSSTTSSSACAASTMLHSVCSRGSTATRVPGTV